MDVTPIAAARASLSKFVNRLSGDAASEPIVIGSHRRPEAVLISLDQYRRLSAPVPAPSLDRLRALGRVIDRLAYAANLRDVRVFGSVARGDQRADSDVDLLVTPQPGATLFDIAQFELDMEVLLGAPVTAVSTASLDEERDGRMLEEAVSL